MRPFTTVQTVIVNVTLNLSYRERRYMTARRRLTMATAVGAILIAGVVGYAHSNQDNHGFGFSQPTVLWTPPLIPQGADTEIDCYIINVSKKPRFVVIDALDRDGNKVVDSWSGIVEPGHEEVNKANANVNPRSCRFIVEGTANQFRASGLVVLHGVGSISALPAE